MEQKEMASLGGKARWKGKTKEERSKEMQHVASFREKKNEKNKV